MRRIGVFLLLAGSALAGPKYPNCVRDKDKALEIARTRGKLIFLTVIVYICEAQDMSRDLAGRVVTTIFP